MTDHVWEAIFVVPTFKRLFFFVYRFQLMLFAGSLKTYWNCIVLFSNTFFGLGCVGGKFMERLQLEMDNGERGRAAGRYTTHTLTRHARNGKCATVII